MKSILNRRTTIFTTFAFAVMTLSASKIASAQDSEGTRVDANQNIEVNVNDSECFPMCKPAVTSFAASADNTDPTKAIACSGQSTGLIKQAEQLNDRVKPIKEIVGYIRSPQGLAIKLVNDHVVKIPAWIGYAMDPVGSLKSRAIDEVRTRAKAAVGLNHLDAGCTPEVSREAEPTLIPWDTEKV